MRKLLAWAAACAALTAAPAIAADMPVYKAPVPTWTWAGFYIGAHGGYGWKKDDFHRLVNDTPVAFIDGINSKGSLYGGHAGYNWQSGWWVTGLELDFSATRIRGDSDRVTTIGANFTETFLWSDDVKYLGSARARVGIAPLSGCCWNVMLYGTAGLAWERVIRTTNHTVANDTVNFVSTIKTPADRFGWVAGLGGEAQLAGSNLVARIEYLHYEFGTTEVAATATGIGLTTIYAEDGGRQRIDVLRAGLSYKFN